MTSSNGKIFRVTCPLCGNSPVIRKFSTQSPVTRSFDVFFNLRLNKPLSEAGDSRRHRGHYGVTAMDIWHQLFCSCYSKESLYLFDLYWRDNGLWSRSLLKACAPPLNRWRFECIIKQFPDWPNRQFYWSHCPSQRFILTNIKYDLISIANGCLLHRSLNAILSLCCSQGGIVIEMNVHDDVIMWLKIKVTQYRQMRYNTKLCTYTERGIVIRWRLKLITSRTCCSLYSFYLKWNQVRWYIVPIFAN